MEGTEKRIPQQRKPDSTELLREGPYLDVCLSEDELSDWSEEDLSLHFSASVLNPSESESEPELPSLDLDHRGPDLQPQVQSPDPYLDLPEDKPHPQRLPQQQEQPRPQLFLRQHSLPESGGAYKGLIAGLQTQTGGAQVQRRLQKSFSLDETRTKIASCLIKNVLSKRMQEEDQQVAPKTTKPRPKPTEDQPKSKVQAPPRPAPPQGSALTSKPPSRGHMIKLAASLSQSQRRTETSQPITVQRCSSQPITVQHCSSQPITALLHSDLSNVNQSEQRSSRELQAPLAPLPAQEQSSSLGHSQPSEDPPWSSSRDSQTFSSSAQEQSSSLGCHQSGMGPPWFTSRELQIQSPQPSPSAQEKSSSLVHCQPSEKPPWFSSRELQRKVSHESCPAQEQSSSLSHSPPTVDLPRFSTTELHHHSTPAQEKATSVGHSRPKVPQRFSSSRKLQTKASRASPSAQKQASSLGHSLCVDPPRFSSTELHTDARHSVISAQEQSSSLVRNLQTVPPPWVSSRDPAQSSVSAQDQRSSRGHRQMVVAPPWFSSRDAPQSSAPPQTQASAVSCVHPVPPWSSSSELQAPLPSHYAQDEASSLGCVGPVLPWFSSCPGAVGGVSDPQEFVGTPSHVTASHVTPSHVTPSHVTSVKGGLQRKTLLDPETGQFVQVFVPVSGHAPMLHYPTPVLAGPAPSVLPLGYGSSLLSVTPNPTMLVPVQPTVFTQPCFMFPPLQPWIYYRPA